MKFENNGYFVITSRIHSAYTKVSSKSHTVFMGISILQRNTETALTGAALNLTSNDRFFLRNTKIDYT